MSYIKIFVAIFGWLFAHWLNDRRDRNNQNRKMRTDVLISAFRDLANSADRQFILGADNNQSIERALVDINLIGTKKQAQLVKELAEDVRNKSRISINSLDLLSVATQPSLLSRPCNSLIYNKKFGSEFLRGCTSLLIYTNK